MEDKKVLEFINKNHDMQYQQYIKASRRKRKFDIAYNIILILAVIISLLIFGNEINNQTKKEINKCLKNGNTRAYCLKDVQ